MTLGKIERFWKTIYEEFLVRAQFGSFEEAQERIRQWVKYYNHKRPHQGIGGLFPADRYFEMLGELRKVMEKRIAENVLEMALRGKPREPFYMVGRMEGQSVVLRAEKGKLRLMVDDEDGGKVQEVVYEVSPQKEKEERDGKSREAEGREAGGGGENRAEGVGAYGRGEVPGGIVPLDGAEEAGRGLPGDGGYPRYLPDVPSSFPRWTQTSAYVGYFPVLLWPSPYIGWVGVHNFPFEACSRFTHVTARRFAARPRWTSLPGA